MATVKTIPVSNVSADEYEPFMVGDEHVGDVHWLRTESGGEGQLYAGLWTLPAANHSLRLSWR